MMNKTLVLALSALVLLPVWSAAGQQVAVTPEETNDILANPGMGWQTFLPDSTRSLWPW